MPLPTERLVDAVCLANPFVLASRVTGTNTTICATASACLAAALRKKGVDARPQLARVLSYVTGESGETPIILGTGHSAETFYAAVCEAFEGIAPFEQFMASSEYQGEGAMTPHGFHVIVAVAGTPTHFIDPTAVQMGQRLGTPSLFTVSWRGAAVASLEHGPAVLHYSLGSPKMAHKSWRVDPSRFTGFVEDYAAMIDLALACDLDFDLFVGELERQAPEQWANIAAKLHKIRLGDSSDTKVNASTKGPAL